MLSVDSFIKANSHNLAAGLTFFAIFLFKSLSYQYVSDEYLTKEAIAEKAGKVKPFTSFCFNYKITENGFSFSTGAFPD